MIPATTIWNTGTRFENSVLQKQKFVYRRQRGCQLVPVPINPCYVISSIFDYTCATEYVEFYIYPWLNTNLRGITGFNSILANRVGSFLASSGLTLNDCIETSIKTTWYLDLKIGNDQVILEQFYTGYGFEDVPTNTLWRNTLITYLPNLYTYGFTYTLNGNFLTITSLTLEPRNVGENVSLNVGIGLSINCNTQ